MYGISHIRSVSVGLDSQIWYLFIYITGYLNVRKMSETMDFRTFVGSLLFGIKFENIALWLVALVHSFNSVLKVSVPCDESGVHVLQEDD